MSNGPSLRDVKEFRFRINPVEVDVGRDIFGYRVMRPISVYLTWILLRLGFTANQVTVLQMAVGVAGAILVAWGNMPLRLLGIAQLYIGFLLDNCDGEIARYRGEVTVTGQFLDTFCHHIINGSLIAGIGVAAWRQTGRPEALALGFAASLASQRVDLTLAMAGALDALRRPMDQAYTYFSRCVPLNSPRGLDDLHGQAKRGGSRFRRFLFGTFSYPGLMHVVLLLTALDLTAGYFKLVPGLSVWLVAVLGYGILLPIRRAMTVRAVVRDRLADRLYFELRQQGETS